MVGNVLFFHENTGKGYFFPPPPLFSCAAHSASDKVAPPRPTLFLRPRCLLSPRLSPSAHRLSAPPPPSAPYCRLFPSPCHPRPLAPCRRPRPLPAPAGLVGGGALPRPPLPRRGGLLRPVRFRRLRYCLRPLLALAGFLLWPADPSRALAAAASACTSVDRAEESGKRSASSRDGEGAARGGARGRAKEGGGGC